MLRDDEQARDATQDALVRAWLESEPFVTRHGSTPGSTGPGSGGCYEQSARIRRRRSVEIRVDASNWPVEAGDDHRVDARAIRSTAGSVA